MNNKLALFPWHAAFQEKISNEKGKTKLARARRKPIRRRNRTTASRCCVCICMYIYICMLDIDRHGASREASRAVPTPFDPDNAVRTGARTSAFIFNPRRHRYSHDGDICKYRFWKAYLAEQWPLFSVFQCPLSASSRLRAYTHIYAHMSFLSRSLSFSRVVVAVVALFGFVDQPVSRLVCLPVYESVCMYVCSLTTVWRCRRWSLGGDFPFPLLACVARKSWSAGRSGRDGLMGAWVTGRMKMREDDVGNTEWLSETKIAAVNLLFE